MVERRKSRDSVASRTSLLSYSYFHLISYFTSFFILSMFYGLVRVMSSRLGNVLVPS